MSRTAGALVLLMAVTACGAAPADDNDDGGADPSPGAGDLGSALLSEEFDAFPNDQWRSVHVHVDDTAGHPAPSLAFDDGGGSIHSVDPIPVDAGVAVSFDAFRADPATTGTLTVLVSS